MSIVRGNHHFTSSVGGAQEDFDFHTRLLGLRHLKQTGLFEGTTPIYHLYYGNTEGDAGAILTTFPVGSLGLTGNLGTDQISRLNVSIPTESIGFWRDRLGAAGIEVEQLERHGLQRLHFRHPCGLPHALVADGYGDPARSWEQGGVAADHAILGNHGITVNVSELAPMVEYLESGIGAVREGDADDGARWRVGDPKSGRIGYVELVEDADAPAGTQSLGVGTIHHCAWDVAGDADQTELRTHLTGLGYDDWVGPRDRVYFVSVYNRTPGGALFEYAWSAPGLWTVDEAIDDLGREFKVPPMFEDQRESYSTGLEALDVGVERAHDGVRA